MENLLYLNFVNNSENINSSKINELNLFFGKPKILYDEDKGMIIDDRIFKDSNERDRTIIEYSKNFPPRNDSEISFEVEMSSKQFYEPKLSNCKIPIMFGSRMENIKEDPRLCCSTFLVSDIYTGMKYGFVMTNEIIYIYYGRSKTECGNEASFISLIPVSRRLYNCENDKNGILNDFKKLKITFQKKKNWIAKWYVDDECFYVNNQLGSRVEYEFICFEGGGISTRAKIECLKLSITHSSFLDYQLPKNTRQEFVNTDRSGKNTVYRSCSGLVQLYKNDLYKEIRPNLVGKYVSIIPKLSFLYSLEESEADNKLRTFGQGVITIIKSLKVFYQKNIINCSYLSNFTSFSDSSCSSDSKCSSNYQNISMSCGDNNDKSTENTSCPSLITLCDEFSQENNCNLITNKKNHCNLITNKKNHCEVNLNQKCQNQQYDVTSLFQNNQDGNVTSFQNNQDSDVCQIMNKKLKCHNKSDKYIEKMEILSKKSHNFCWKCEKVCNSLCCSGKCGSKSCHYKNKKNK